MTDTHLSDRMPEVARGDSAWAASEAAHLDRCADCAAEWLLVRTTVAAAPAPAVEADRVAARVLDRLRAERQVLPIASHRRWRRWVVGLAAAASVALAVTIWQPWTLGTAPVAIEPARERTLLPELDALLEAELEVVLAALEPEPVEPLGAVPRIGDLTDEELELLLEEVEG